MNAMPTGRRPAPAKLRLLRGNERTGRDSGGRKVDPGPGFRRRAPEKPADLTPDAAAHWDAVVPELARLELLGPHHLGATWSRWRRAQREMVAGELTSGTRRQPYVVIAETAARQYVSFAAEFGLTASAEGRLGVRNWPAGGNPFSGERYLTNPERLLT